MDGTSAHYPPRTSVHSGASSDKIDTDDDAGVVLTPDHTSTFGQSISPGSLSTFAFATDELCSRELFKVIIHDYIERVYPLCPVVHLPSFRRSLASNQDVHDTEQMLLLVALFTLTIGVLRSRIEDYRAMDPEAAARFPTRTSIITYASQMCLRLRPPDYWDEISHRKWAISYTLASAAFEVGRMNQYRMFDSEAMQLARLLGFHLHATEYRGLNCIETQLRKKAFWLQFFSFAHSKVQPGRRRFHVTYLDNYVLRDVDFAALEPLDTPDENITENAVCPPPPDGTAPFTSVTAFIVNTRVFLEALRDSLFNAGCDCGYGRTNEEKLARLKALFQRYKYSLDALPSHMTQWGPSSIYDSGPSTPAANSVSRAQAETTRANIHITHLWLQSFLLDQTDGIVQAMAAAGGGGGGRGAGDDEAWVAHQLASSWAEREDICRQLLHVLHNIDGFHLEPNGNSLTYKIRGVATSLLNCPSLLGESVSQRAAGYVREFTKVLAFLDLSEIMNTDGVDTWIDKDRLGDGRASAAAAAADAASAASFSAAASVS
ncbi:hypothetical protein D7B24_008113 [Verticillium nonalfalfae]|uniref:Transcription factor domain-containing protein n=1 Tax=Verticillium nonalfalfae TaxID=1051616 RepID=A0A3M9YKD4_9PEZI|nr:uncharacterized protein D7B24_008113 [Verticillium nonalfalfae]RNJ60422.1 hypothetical protein D7B24_008113 [Verticillium nonalfalfae]